jgi:hypothetical protein
VFKAQEDGGELLDATMGQEKPRQLLALKMILTSIDIRIDTWQRRPPLETA